MEKMEKEEAVEIECSGVLDLPTERCGVLSINHTGDPKHLSLLCGYELARKIKLNIVSPCVDLNYISNTSIRKLKVDCDTANFHTSITTLHTLVVRCTDRVVGLTKLVRNNPSLRYVKVDIRGKRRRLLELASHLRSVEKVWFRYTLEEGGGDKGDAFPFDQEEELDPTYFPIEYAFKTLLESSGKLTWFVVPVSRIPLKEMIRRIDFVTENAEPRRKFTLLWDEEEEDPVYAPRTSFVPIAKQPLSPRKSFVPIAEQPLSHEEDDRLYAQVDDLFSGEEPEWDGGIFDIEQGQMERGEEEVNLKWEEEENLKEEEDGPEEQGPEEEGPEEQGPEGVPEGVPEEENLKEEEEENAKEEKEENLKEEEEQNLKEEEDEEDGPTDEEEEEDLSSLLATMFLRQD